MIKRENYNDIFISILQTKFNVNLQQIKHIESKEGIIITDGNKVFKCLTLLNEQQDLIIHSLNTNAITKELIHLHKSFIETNQLIVHFFLNLKALSEAIKNNKIKTIINFEVFLINDLIIIVMPFVNITNFYDFDNKSIIAILKDFKKINWLSLDFEPKNIKQTNKNLIFIDIGFFFVPFYEEGFKTMCKRAYMSLHFLNSSALKDYLRKAITEKDLSFLPNKIIHQKQFEIFYREVLK
jgi:hypothetical protein